ncbi:MAG: replication initiation protein [Eubacterium sp.]
MNKNTNNLINNLGRDTDKLIVQKSRPLLHVKQFTLNELKILDVYLSRINSKNPECRTVVFEKGELEKIFGVKRIRTEVLDKSITNMMTIVDIPDESSKKGYTKIALFEKTHLEQDENKIWKVEMTCTEAARKYIFNVDEIGYLLYRLHSILPLKSKYAYYMFLYLEDNRFRKKWTVEINSLREILGCEDEYYDEYKHFNQKILKVIHKEINEKTMCKYKYKKITKGNNVVGIQFTVESNNRYRIEDDNDVDVEAVTNELWVEALSGLDITLSKEQLDELRSILVTIPDILIPDVSSSPDNIHIGRYHYMDRKVREIMRRDKEKKINNKYNYLVAVMKKDAAMY